MVAIVLPRLTNTLRESQALNNSSTESNLIDFESIYLSTQKILVAKREKAREDVEFDSGDEKVLWEKLVSLEKERDQKKKQLFRAYLKNVKEIVGEQSDSVQIASSATFVFQNIISGNKKSILSFSF